jgi:HD-like signal output (HDOD) protein
MIYQRLMEVINHPRGGTSDVANVIREDTALTARLLKVVNSAFFAFPRRVETVSQAVTVVGTSQVRDLALATSVVALFKDVPSDLVEMDGFWRHSLACGAGARVLASFRRESNVERFFVAGILHDLGKLVLYQKAPDEAREALMLARAENVLLHQAERRVLGFNHAQVGEALLAQWNMPLSLREALRFHHDPRRAERFPVEAAAIHAADVLANGLGLGSAGERFVPPLSQEAWSLLDVEALFLSNGVEEMERQYEASVHLVGQG